MPAKLFFTPSWSKWIGVALIFPKKSAGTVNNEESFNSGPGVAHGGTEHSVHEAEAEYEEDGRSCKTESTAKKFCSAQISAGTSSTQVNR